MTPPATRILGLALLVMTGLLAAPTWPAPAAAEPWAPIVVAPTEFHVSVSEYHGRETRSFASGDDVSVTLRTYPGGRGLSVRVVPAGEGPFDVRVTAPPGEALEERRYPEAPSAWSPDLPSMDAGFQHEGCGAPTLGAFELHRFEPDLSAVWLSWRNECHGSSGEVRVGVPEPSDEVSLSPRQVEWNVRRTGTSTPSLPVRLRNTGAGELSVEEVRLVGGSEHYRAVADEDCAAVAPGTGCDIGLTFTPAGAEDGGRPGRLRVTLADGTRHHVDIRAEALAGTWRVAATDGDGVRYTGGPSTIAVGGDRTTRAQDPREYVQVISGQGSDQMSLYLEPPRGELLQPGRTYDVARVLEGRPRTTATMTVTTSGSTCYGWGRVHVHDIAYVNLGRGAAFRTLDRLSLTFDWRCPADEQPGARGTVAVHVDAAPGDAGRPGAISVSRAGAWRGTHRATDVRPGTRARMRVDVAPAGRGGCARLITEHREGKRWLRSGGTACRATGPRGVVRLPTATADLRPKTRVRVRALWRTAPTPLGREEHSTQWTYLKVQ